MAPPEQEYWQDTYRIRAYETAADGLAGLTTICNYLQESAGNHATRLGVALDDLARENRTWVMLRLKLEVDRYPAWREEVSLRTWPSGLERLFTLRDYELRDAGDRVIARGSSVWLVIDRDSRRPVRLPAEITGLIRPDSPRALQMDTRRPVPGPDTAAYQYETRTRLADLDINGHVNNVHYVEWALHTLEDDFLASNRCAEMTIQYLSECASGSRVHAETDSRTESGQTLCRHLITRASDGTALARMESRWLPVT